MEELVKKFHSHLLKVRGRGTYQLCDIANMDQTPIPFILDDCKTYASTGSKDVWSLSGKTGLDKRQFTAQLTVFGDGIPRVEPLIILRWKGVRIKSSERQALDKRVRVTFQGKAWCDEKVMVDWIKTDWGNFFPTLRPRDLTEKS